MSSRKHRSPAAGVAGAGSVPFPPESEQAAWRQFADGVKAPDFCRAWLAIQCGSIPGVADALVVLVKSNGGSFAPMAFWPEGAHNRQHLAAITEQTLQERRVLVVPYSGDSQDEVTVLRHHLGYPIEVDGQLVGAVILDIEPRSQSDLQAVIRQLQWGTAWLELRQRRERSSDAELIRGRLTAMLDVLGTSLEHPRFHAAVTACVTEIATELNCDRVSLGLVEQRHARVRALSHSVQFEKQTNLVTAIGAAMDEALDQHAAVVHPPLPDDPVRITRAHAALARQHGCGANLTIPLVHHGADLGALTLERPSDRPFDRSTVDFCLGLAALLGPIVDIKRRNDRGLVRTLLDWLRERAGRLFGPGYLVTKFVVVLILALGIFVSVATGPYRVSATTRIEGEVERSVVAPFNGYIEEAFVRAGDVVRQGQALYTLDDRDLTLERAKWSSQREQHLKQYREAMANHDRAQTKILGAQVEQAEAELALIEEQLTRTQVTAPLDGIIVSGDLSQTLGAPVERGEVLFKMAPLASYRVILEVDERDIRDVAIAQRGDLVLSSLPSESLPFAIVKITPVSTAKEGRNFFRVEARLEQVTERLRPGMEGVGKVYVDERRLIWIGTHSLVDWMRLWAWSWLP